GTIRFAKHLLQLRGGEVHRLRERLDAQDQMFEVSGSRPRLITAAVELCVRHILHSSRNFALHVAELLNQFSFALRGAHKNPFHFIYWATCFNPHPARKCSFSHKPPCVLQCCDMVKVRVTRLCPSLAQSNNTPST